MITNKTKLISLMISGSLFFAFSLNAAEKVSKVDKASRVLVLKEVADAALDAGGHRTTSEWAKQGNHRSAGEWLAQGNHRSVGEWLAGVPSRNSRNKRN